MADAPTNQVPSEPPPKDPALLNAWLTRLWKAAKELEQYRQDNEERIETLESA
jgi:hypothetical protein